MNEPGQTRMGQGSSLQSRPLTDPPAVQSENLSDTLDANSLFQRSWHCLYDTKPQSANFPKQRGDKRCVKLLLKNGDNTFKPPVMKYLNSYHDKRQTACCRLLCFASPLKKANPDLFLLLLLNFGIYTATPKKTPSADFPEALRYRNSVANHP